jgi:lipopolysaccharide biosynthesis regulator YciM
MRVAVAVPPISRPRFVRDLSESLPKSRHSLPRDRGVQGPVRDLSESLPKSRHSRPRDRERDREGGGRTAVSVSITIALVFVASIASAAFDDDLRDGDRYFESADWPRAAAAFDRAIAKAPGQVSAEAYGKRAAIFIILKSYQPGLDFIAKAKARHPGAPEILEQEALILWETDRRDAAIGVAEGVVAKRPQTFTNQKLIGEFYATRDPLKTSAAYEAYLTHRPASLESGDVLPRVRLGFAYISSARVAIAEGGDDRARDLFGKAVVQFETVQRKHANRPNAQTNADNGLCAAYTGLVRFDEAVTVCERVTRDPKRVDAAASAWFNLATAYLERKNLKQARAAAVEFSKVRKNEARAFLLLGDIAFANREWAVALDNYGRAEKLVKPDQGRERARISIGLGKTYRRLPTPNIALAIEKLAAAYAADPTSSELAFELGGAYLEAKQDARAIALLDAVLAGSAFAKASPAVRANVLVLAGKARFNLKELDKARLRFEEAQKLLSSDVAIRRGLVLVIGEQAFEAARKDPKAARALLDQALAIDPASTVTITNLAVLAIDAGDCEAARQHLTKLDSIRGHDTVVRQRLLARSYLCGPRPDSKRAAEAYAAADKAARRASTPGVLAEILTEWAPLIWDSDLEGAIEKLELAVKTAGQDADIGPPARRNLALALYRRGWKRMRDNKSADAVSDFERAARDPSVLRGSEPQTFELSYALALLDAGRAADAAKLFKALQAKGNLGSYLKPPLAKIGPQLLTAYASYRIGTLAARQQAVAELAKLEPDAQGFADKLRELIASSWESIAFDQWRGGQLANAKQSLQSADKYAKPGGEIKRRIGMDRTALALTKSDVRSLEQLGNNPVEALVNLGIVYEMLGRPKDALDAWQRARGRVQVRDLQKWIDAKKRVYGL